jgi:hypothetical protein
VALGVLAAYADATSVPVRRGARRMTRAALGRRARFVEDVDAHDFQKGNVHTHSLLSDGKAPLEAVVAWYRDHGYDFLAMTEHDQRLDPGRLAWMQTDHFVVIPGEELTDYARRLPLHVNSLCADASIGGAVNYARAEDGIADVFGLVRAHGGVPLLNHPNFHFALNAEQIAAGAQGFYLLEIWSGHPSVAPAGDALHVSEEAIWDDVLARGATPAPAAVDDTHDLTPLPGQPAALPGRGWIETFGAETSRDAICRAIARGELYASSGPSFTEIRVSGDTFSVSVDNPTAEVVFVGERGEALATRKAIGSPPTAEYKLRGGESLVRARIAVSGVGRAWTAAYRVTDTP